jgi:ABC-2 type transport system permease protein
MAGMMAVFRKELADHLTSLRFVILLILVMGLVAVTMFIAAGNIRSYVTSDTHFIFLTLFIIPGPEVPVLGQISFPIILAIFIPIIGIILGFDTINSERTSGNLSRIMSQPLYRDSVINGKFLAGLTTLTILIVATVVLVGGMGLRMIGVPPAAEEILRLFAFIFVSIIYGAFWMALAILFSVVFKNTATSILVSLGIWILLFLFISPIAQTIAGSIVPVDQNSSLDTITKYDQIYHNIRRISPNTLYGEATAALLVPEIGNMSTLQMIIGVQTGGLKPSPLPLGQSLVLVWPQLTSLIALTCLCFAGSYIRFMREEIRAT